MKFWSLPGAFRSQRLFIQVKLFKLSIKPAQKVVIWFTTSRIGTNKMQEILCSLIREDVYCGGKYTYVHAYVSSNFYVKVVSIKILSLLVVYNSTSCYTETANMSYLDYTKRIKTVIIHRLQFADSSKSISVKQRKNLGFLEIHI